MHPQYRKIQRAVLRPILSATICALAAISFSSSASIIGSSYGNAVHIDLSIKSGIDNSAMAIARVNLAHTSGSAPEDYSQTRTLVGAAASTAVSVPSAIDVTQFESGLSTAILQGQSQSSLTSFIPTNFDTFGRGTINNLNLDLFSDLLGISSFLTLSAEVLSTISKVDGNVGVNNDVSLSAQGSSNIANAEVNLLGHRVTLSALENQSLFANLNIADFGLGIFVNEASISCSDTSCTESRNAVRVSFNDFSLNALYSALSPLGGTLPLGTTFNLPNNPVVNGEIILASSFATTAAPAAVNAPATFALMIFAMGLVSARRFSVKKPRFL